MNLHQVVPPRGRPQQLLTQSRLESVETPPQSQQRRMHRRVSGVRAKQAGVDQVSRRRGLGALGEKEHQRSLLLGEANLAAADLDGSVRRVELEASEAVAARAA